MCARPGDTGTQGVQLPAPAPGVESRRREVTVANDELGVITATVLAGMTSSETGRVVAVG